jgi:hypothetical protein
MDMAAMLTDLAHLANRIFACGSVEKSKFCGSFNSLLFGGVVCIDQSIGDARVEDSRHHRPVTASTGD